MFIATCGDGDAQVDRFAIPVHPLRKLEESERRPADQRAGLIGAMRDRDTLAHVGRDMYLALQDRFGVATVDRTDFFEERPRLAQRVPFVVGVLCQSNGLSSEDASGRSRWHRISRQGRHRRGSRPRPGRMPDRP